MASYNKIIMIGNLTRDPQMSYLPSQTPVVEFGLAVNRRWRGSDNQQREETCFIDCRAYGKQAETINQYLAKGRSVLVEGRLEFDSWEGKDGVKRSKHRIFVERFSFVGPAPAGGAAPRAGQPARPPQQAQPQQSQQPQQAPPPGEPMESAPPPYEEEQGGGEDIPF
jgi:single-strand DNA-binding protein